MAMDDLKARLERNAGWRNEEWQCVTDPALLSEAAARISELEAQLAARDVAVVAWLQDYATFLDKHDDGRSGFDKMAQGLREAVEAIELGEHLK